MLATVALQEQFVRCLMGETRSLSSMDGENFSETAFFEPHLLAPFIHFLPLSWQRRLVRNFTLWGWATRPSQASVDRMLGGLHLLDGATFRDLFPDCEIRRERFLGFTKAFVAVRIEAR